MPPTAPLHPRQRGVALVLFTIGTLAILGVAGLAVDLGLAYIARTRVQNAVDAAALTAARHLSLHASPGLAASAAQAAYALNQAGLDPAIVPQVEMSPTLVPFNPAGSAPKFVRVSVTAMPSPLRFASVLPGIGGSIGLDAVAVAGPIPLGQICNALPLAVCGTGADTDCSDGACFGLGPNEFEIKGDARSLGPGNYGLLVLDCVGANCVRDGMAGGSELCFEDGGTVLTQPGVASGAAAQGLNTRFGVYQGPVSAADYPPDVVTRHVPALTHAQYQAALATPALWDYPPPAGVAQRRIAVTPIVDCSAPLNGRTRADVLGAACVFLTQPVDGGNGTLRAEVAPDCLAEGTVAETPGTSAAHKIVLYQNAS